MSPVNCDFHTKKLIPVDGGVSVDVCVNKNTQRADGTEEAKVGKLESTRPKPISVRLVSITTTTLGIS